jgi:polyisoprenoid-binding protein YceI
MLWHARPDASILPAMNTTTATASTTTTQKWTIDPTHTTVGFSVRHLMITNVHGEFQKVSGKVTYDPARPEATRIDATVDVASINTREAQRDTHLKSGDFFDAEKFPTITFVSKSAKSTGQGSLEITGDLTIRGTTKEVKLTASDITGEQKDPWGNQRIGATATTKIKRSDFGMTWNAVLEAGGLTVGDEVKITLDASLIKDK